MRRRIARPINRIQTGKGDWYRISNATGGDNGPAVIDIYDEIGWLGVSAADFITELRDITASQIELHINSPGGDVYDGLAIYNALLDHPATVTTKVDGLAASAASFIAQAGDRVVMGRNAEMMIHDAIGLTVGNEADHIEMARRLSAASDNIAGIYNARAGGGVKSWRDRMSDETWYSAQEAVDAGLADEVQRTDRRGHTQNTADRWDLSIFKYRSRDEAPGPNPKTDPPVSNGNITTTNGNITTATTITTNSTNTNTSSIQFIDTTDKQKETKDEPTEPSLEELVEALKDYDPTKIHLAILDAADENDLGVDTLPIREALIGADFDYDPDAIRGTILEVLNHVESGSPAPKQKESPPQTVRIDDLITALIGANIP